MSGMHLHYKNPLKMIGLWKVVFGNKKCGRKGVIQKGVCIYFVTSKFTGESK